MYNAHHPTHKVPLSICNISCNVSINHLQVQRPSPIRPGAKLQITPLKIKGEPADIDVAGAFEYPCEQKCELTDMEYFQWRVIKQIFLKALKVTVTTIIKILNINHHNYQYYYFVI